MKTKHTLIFILITFVTLSFLPNSFAQVDSPEYVVRIIYFIPKDREPDPTVDELLDTVIKDVQMFYADQMEAHGFGRKTFRFEADTAGKALVHHIVGKFNNTHYDIGDLAPYIEEINEYFDTSKNIYLIIVPKIENLCGYAPLGKYAFVSEDCVKFTVVAHELGHTFGLIHDWRDDVYIMSYGRYQSELSLCAAQILDVNPYFNPTQGPLNYNTTVQMLPPILAKSQNAIRLSFQVSDPDGLYLARLGTFHDYTLASCILLHGKNNMTIEFMTTEFPTKENNPIVVHVFDIHGTQSHAEFVIDINDLLLQREVISIPDTNLAAAVRKTLKLAPNSTITQLDMLNLRDLQAGDKQIMNLTGLEHAKNLSTLNLSGNQIVDLTPIAGLTQLTSLNLRSNQFDDITPITGITRLKILYLDNNLILDFTPFTALTQLHHLSLGHNSISNIDPIVSVIRKLTSLRSLYLSDNLIGDVSPLVELTNLKELTLVGNPIKNRKPLLALLQKNPHIKIYLKNYRELLPVSLSHFRAEQTAAGVLIKWTTESELDNAGFYIYRSETKDGEFKVVNPTLIQGAGTTSERHTYTWTDTTAKPNTVYYYRIEDVSHAGVRKQLATVRMRGYVSAAGKLTTRWADLKANN